MCIIHFLFITLFYIHKKCEHTYTIMMVNHAGKTSNFSVCVCVCVCPSSAAGGEIFNQCVAERDEAFKEDDVKRLMRQILEGVAFLHRKHHNTQANTLHRHSFYKT